MINLRISIFKYNFVLNINKELLKFMKLWVLLLFRIQDNNAWNFLNFYTKLIDFKTSKKAYERNVHF